MVWHTDYGNHLAVLLGPPTRPTRLTLTINTSWQSFLGPPIRPTCLTLIATLPDSPLDRQMTSPVDPHDWHTDYGNPPGSPSRTANSPNPLDADFQHFLAVLSRTANSSNLLEVDFQHFLGNHLAVLLGPPI
eukprot:SAG11_NODE_20108_length_452_cov_1.396601_1_plen_131_part_10